ncbi:hypothetical protein ACWDXV_33950 [Nocardia nova]
MLVIKLTRAQPQDEADDPLDREYYGWDPHRTSEENWNSNRGYWALGTKAAAQRHVLFVFEETVVMAAEITAVVEAGPAHPGRRILEGAPLSAGDPVHDSYVGKRGPVKSLRARNPVTYHEDKTPGFGRLCLCGCRTEVYDAHFVAGHDQAALHQRVAKIGTIPQFIEWFDKSYPATSPSAAAPREREVFSIHGEARVEIGPDGDTSITFTSPRGGASTHAT